MRTIHKALAAAAFTGLALSCAPQPSFASPSNAATSQVVDTTAPGTPRNGWIWRLPNGTTMGACPTGYTPQWNTVHDYQHRAYWATIEQADGTTKPAYGLTWAQWFDRMNTSGVRNPIWYGVGDLGGGTETTNPVGYNPPLGELDEGDCVKDGTALQTPNDHFNGSGDTYPIVKPSAPVTTPAKPKPAVRYYQHDSIRVTNPAQARQLAAAIHNGVLVYRGDKLSWGHSTWSFTTTAKHSTGRAVVGQTVDLYWQLDTAHGAKPQQANGLAWGPKHSLVQTLVR